MNYGDLVKNLNNPNEIEILEKRTENSKTFDLGNGQFRWGGKIGAIHYKEDYEKDLDWKEIDTSYKTDMGDYWLYDRMPVKVKVFKDRVGYEIESRRSGHTFRVELETKKVKSEDVEFEFDIQPDRVRLWKTIKTDRVKKLKWKVTEGNKKEGLHSLKFRETPEAIDLSLPINDPDRIFQILTAKTPIDSNSFHWEEDIPKANIKIDTDVNEQVGATGDDCYENGSSIYTSAAYLYLSNGAYWHRTASRFTTVNIPNGATIDSASWVGHTYHNSQTISIYISGHNADDSAQFTTQSDLRNASITGAVAWSPDCSGDPHDITSPSLVTAIGNITSRVGWVANNALSIITYAWGFNAGSVYSWDGSTTYAPKLNITYTASGGASASFSPSLSVSKSPSKSASISRSFSPSVSPSASLSKSISVSKSPSVSASISKSKSPSISRSVSPSISRSKSPSISASLSPSASLSKSLSVSKSPSISASISRSASPSLSRSVSPSLSKSKSPSLSASLSPSASFSPSLSPSPSPGWNDYTRGAYAALPADDTNLGTAYSAQDVIDVGTANDTRVGQNSDIINSKTLILHQFKDYVGGLSAWRVQTELQSSLAPSSSPVYLQIFNQISNEWETIDSDSATGADTDFVLAADIMVDVDNYKDGDTISCRVYQENA